MPVPNTSDAIARPDLESSFIEFDLEARERGFIADQVLPYIDVQEPLASFKKIPVEAMLAERDTDRASGGSYPRASWKFEEDSYDTKEQGAEEPVDERDSNIYGRYFQLEQLATQRARNVVMVNREKRVAAAIFNTSTWTGASLTTVVGAPWSSQVSGTPLSDTQAAAEKIFEGTGLIANALVLNRMVLRWVRNSDEVLERVKYSGFTNPAKITLEELAGLLFPDVPNARVIVAGGARNTLNPGQASVSISRIWGDTMAMVCVVSDKNDLSDPCMGRTIHYVGDGSQLPCRIESYRDEEIRSDIIRCRHDVCEKILYTGAGHLLTNIG